MLELVAVDGPDPTTIRAARHLLDHAMPLDLGDDRFDHRWAEELTNGTRRFAGVVALSEVGHPIGYLGGLLDDGRIQLDALVSDHGGHASDDVLDRMMRFLDEPGRLPPDTTIEIWGKPAFEWHDQVASDHGFVPLRALHQMRVPLPVDVAPLPSRAFVPGVDDEPLRQLNNLAFADHPDQGDLDPEAFAAKLTEPGVSPDGIRLHEDDDGLAGFCITKIHHDRGLGEIFAIGLHPRVHGRGLGAPMTATGLDWLHGQGLRTGMLYVEADNTPAIRTYERLGFRISRTDRAWHRPAGRR